MFQLRYISIHFYKHDAFPVSFPRKAHKTILLRTNSTPNKEPKQWCRSSAYLPIDISRVNEPSGCSQNSNPAGRNDEYWLRQIPQSPSDSIRHPLLRHKSGELSSVPITSFTYAFKVANNNSSEGTDRQRERTK